MTAVLLPVAMAATPAMATNNSRTIVNARTDVNYNTPSGKVERRYEIIGYEGVTEYVDGQIVRSDRDTVLLRADAPLLTNNGNSASSYVDLRTGKIGATATVQGRQQSGNTAVGNGYAAGNARFQEFLTFAASGADAVTTTRIGYEVTLHGILTGAAWWNAFGGFCFQDCGSGGPLDSLFNWGGSSSFLRLGYGNASPNVTYMGAPNSATIRGFVTFDGPTFETYFQMGLGASAEAYGPGVESYGLADLGNTATVRFDLPANVTFTSDSGVFLADARTPAVPEPATWAMMIVGFSVSGAMLRRRRAVLTHAA